MKASLIACLNYLWAKGILGKRRRVFYFLFFFLVGGTLVVAKAGYASGAMFAWQVDLAGV